MVDRLDMRFDAYCDGNAGPIVDHMATADVARDLDLLREAVGDDALTFVGYSYGTFLGVTLREHVPRQPVGPGGRRRRSPRSPGPPAAATRRRRCPSPTRLHSDAGAQATLEEFFRLATTGTGRLRFRRRLGGRYAALAEPALRASSSSTPSPGVGARSATRTWSRRPSARCTTRSLAVPGGRPGAHLELQAPGSARAPRSARHRDGSARQTSPPTTRTSSRASRGCPARTATTRTTTKHGLRRAPTADEEFGYFGRQWTWVTSPCAVWGGFDQDRYMGPFDHDTVKPGAGGGDPVRPGHPVRGRRDRG